MEENLRQSVAVDVSQTYTVSRPSLNRLGRTGWNPKRTAAKTAGEGFRGSSVEVKAQIDERVATYRENVRRGQDAYLDRLTTLLQRKAEVERQTVRHTRDLANLCTTTTEEFEAIAKGRSDEVGESIRDLESAVVDVENDKQRPKDRSN
ncbi:uncharacterized protein A1O9_00739 [Exophiala aquamarina CBS 119918]|uniref:Uncharacterized protein n=1 Tax=Exophiala aquamarina CBS 119918 TaxID=1182545 RepID=A0A072PSF7_9EURO|nr:uncharacterized protein A1O9_00739 [Exophiala aquamarina CBS 119918]KEF62766.1 hypothetical protein A1O9_00739 [Exophiala aquamarina CBS 119918]